MDKRVEQCNKIPYFGTIGRIFRFSAECAPREIFFCVGIYLVLGALPVGAVYVWNLFLERLMAFMDFSGSVQRREDLLVLILLFALSLGAASALPVLTETPDTMLRNQVKKAAYKKLHGKAQRLPFAYYDDPHINDFIGNASNALHDGAFMYFIVSAASAVSKCVTVAMMACLLWSYYPPLAALALIIFIPAALRNVLSRKVMQLRYQQREKRREINTYTDFIVSREYVKETRFWDTTGYFLRKRGNLLKGLLTHEKEVYQKIHLLELCLDVFDSLVYTCCIAACVLLCARGNLLAAQLGALFAAVNAAFSANKGLVDDIVEMRELVHEVYEGFRLFDLEEEERERQEAPWGEIDAKEVFFQYPGTDKAQVRGLDCQIRPGEVVALVGANGAGKSTIAKLLLGLYTPQKGTMEYGGWDISHIDYRCLAGNITAVFEDFNQYKVSILENVALNEGADEEMVRKVLKEVEFHAEKYPEGLQTALGAEFGGMDLSRGEWQKLAMARGYYKEGKLVVLDEPTAALDAKSEYHIYEDFRRICKGKTGIMVTHRLGAARLADRIFYVEDGRITENGTHDELMELDGRYAEMFRAQRGLYID